METTLSREQLRALRTALDFDIGKYLRANSINELNGSEKAERHMRISKTICGFIFNVKPQDRYNYMVSGSWLAVHDYLADVLTDRMDEVIKFPVFEPLYDIDTYKDRFFQVIVDKLPEIKTVAINELQP